MKSERSQQGLISKPEAFGVLVTDQVDKRLELTKPCLKDLTYWKGARKERGSRSTGQAAHLLSSRAGSYETRPTWRALIASPFDTSAIHCIRPNT